MIAAELRGGSKPSLNEALGWIGSRVDDIYGANVGRLEDVWIDPGTGMPRWLLVKEGRFGGHTTLIPFEDATAGAGHVWVPYEREVVREAPEIEPGAPLTHGVEASLRNHYATKAPALYAGRSGNPIGVGQPPPTGTATVRLHGAPPDGPAGGSHAQPASPAAQPPQSTPQPQPPRGVIRGRGAEQSPRIPPYQLPARPAPPVAPPPRQTTYAPQQPPAPQRPPQPEPPADWRPAQQGWQQAAPPPRQPTPPQQPPVPPQQPSWAPQPAQGTPPDPIASLQSLASQPGVHYVEIELAGELSIRGELRSVRVVPR